MSEQHEPDLAALERTMMRAFASERTAREGDEARAALVVQKTLLAVRPPRRHAFRPKQVAILAAAAVAISALAYAALRRVEGEPTPLVAPAVQVAPSATAAAPSEPAAITPEALPSAPEVVASSAAPSTSAVARPKPLLPASAEPEPTAAELFARANEARRASDMTRAIATYEELASRFPTSREASTSRVALGRLLLDRDARRARAAFEAYLAAEPSGALAEEARVGHASSLQRLGEARAEAEAWRDLLANHPGSVHADRARKRLAELAD